MRRLLGRLACWLLSRDARLAWWNFLHPRRAQRRYDGALEELRRAEKNAWWN